MDEAAGGVCQVRKERQTDRQHGASAEADISVYVEFVLWISSFCQVRETRHKTGSVKGVPRQIWKRRVSACGFLLSSWFPKSFSARLPYIYSLVLSIVTRQLLAISTVVERMTVPPLEAWRAHERHVDPCVLLNPLEGCTALLTIQSQPLHGPFKPRRT